MGPAVYILGALTTLVCAILLMRGFLRSRARLLLWSALCFFGLTVSNTLIFMDLVLFPDKDLYLWRLTTAAVSMLILVYGLIWEGEK
jgi:heme/copper-type cytochrome/quinol oxidase subunit 4